MQPLTTLRSHARTLAMASMLALAVAGLPAVHAHALPRQGGGDYGTCGPLFPGDDTPHSSGDIGVNDQGQLVECQEDGSWKPILRVVHPIHQLPIAPIQPAGAAIAP